MQLLLTLAPSPSLWLIRMEYYSKMLPNQSFSLGLKNTLTMPAKINHWSLQHIIL